MTSSVGTRLFGSLGVVLLAVVALSAAPGTALAQSDVTFTKDVLPIFQDSCQTCHREGAIAPMSLMTYEETRPWARSIREKVVTRTMPPWYIDKNIGVQGFKYDRSLNDQQIATVAKRVAEMLARLRHDVELIRRQVVTEHVPASVGEP